MSLITVVTVPDSAIEIGITIANTLRRILRIVKNGIQLWNNTSKRVQLLVSESLTADYSIIFPVNAPTGGQLIGIDGTGQTEFINNISRTFLVITSNTTINPDTHYLVAGNSAIMVELLLPLSSACYTGMYVRVTRKQGDTNEWRITQRAGQQVRWTGATTTMGATGYTENNSTDTSVLLVCVDTDANTYAYFQIIQQEGLPLLV